MFFSDDKEVVVFFVAYFGESGLGAEGFYDFEHRIAVAYDEVVFAGLDAVLDEKGQGVVVVEFDRQAEGFGCGLGGEAVAQVAGGVDAGYLFAGQQAGEGLRAGFALLGERGVVGATRFFGVANDVDFAGGGAGREEEEWEEKVFHDSGILMSFKPEFTQTDNNP
jgi:hypothetical protein